MIDDSTNMRPKPQDEADRRNQLLMDKAVLLIGNDTAVIKELVMQLAKKDADIALLCWQVPADVARKLNETVQSFGRQLILIERVENQRFSVEQLIHNVITKWGHFDFFIDVSTRDVTAVPNKDEIDEEIYKQTAWLPTKWQLARTVLEEMAHA